VEYHFRAVLVWKVHPHKTQRVGLAVDICHRHTVVPQPYNESHMQPILQLQVFVDHLLEIKVIWLPPVILLTVGLQEVQEVQEVYQS
jgi:hypothetical protein